MNEKKEIEVVIDGNVYTLASTDSAAHVQRIAAYLNEKIADFKKMDGYINLNLGMQSLLLELNVADDYFKARARIEELEADLSGKDTELYDIKHELVAAQMKSDSIKKELDALKAENASLKKVLRK